MHPAFCKAIGLFSFLLLVGIASTTKAEIVNTWTWTDYKEVQLNNADGLMGKALTLGIGKLADASHEVQNTVQSTCLLLYGQKGGELGFDGTNTSPTSLSLFTQTDTGAAVIVIIDCKMAPQSLVHFTLIVMGDQARTIAEALGPQIFSSMF